MNIGFIGLGGMGRPMAGHLRAAGHALTVWARHAESAAQPADGFAPDSIHIDFSTIAPSTAHRIAGRYGARGIHFVDAPVSGGTAGAEAATLAIMWGGKSARVLDLFGGKMARRDFAAGVQARLHHKDFAMVLGEAAAQNIPLPVASTVLQQPDGLMTAGWGMDDTSRLLCVLERTGSDFNERGTA